MVRRKSVQRAKTEASGNEFLHGDRGLHRGPTPSYAPFSEDNARRIIDAAFELMSQTGIGFDPEPCLMDRLADAGCEVSPGGLVKFPIELIRRSLDTVAKNVRLWDRDGSGFIEIDNKSSKRPPGVQ